MAIVRTTTRRSGSIRDTDPSSLFTTHSESSVSASRVGGFHWSDAGIGAGTAAGLMLLALGTMLVVRSGRVGSA